MIDSETRLELCQRAAITVLNRHGWRLLDAGDMAAQAAGFLADLPVATALQAERACQQVYAQNLCAAAQDPARQQSAYTELHAYLYRIALHQRPHLAEDAAQEALLLIFQNISTCRSPAAFLKFAIFQLMTAFNRLHSGKEEPSLDAFSESGGDELLADATLNDGASIEAGAVARAQTAEFLRWLKQIMDANPRARNQILAVVMKYLEGRDDADIAAALDTTVANVHVLRSRGLEKLRAEMAKLPESARFFAT